MISDDIIDKMQANWAKLTESQSSSSFEALMSLDKQFQSGPTYKLPGAFKVYEV